MQYSKLSKLLILAGLTSLIWSCATHDQVLGKTVPNTQDVPIQQQMAVPAATN